MVCSCDPTWPRPTIDIRGSQLRIHVWRGDAKRHQPVGQQRYPDFTVDAARALDLRDAANALERPRDDVIDEPGHLLSRPRGNRRCIGDDRHPFDVDPLYRRFLDALRQLRPDVRHRIPNVIHRTIGRRLQLKLDRRDGHPIRDARRYVLDPDDSGRRILDVLRDLRFQLARRSTCLDDGDGDDGDVDVGHLRDRQGLQADRAEHDQDDKEYQRRNGLANRPGGDVEGHINLLPRLSRHCGRA